MKKSCTILLVVLAISLLASSTAFADEWRKEPRENTNSAMLFSYSLDLPDGSCRVNIMTDGSVTGYGIIHNRSGKVTIEYIILKIEEGKMVLEKDISHSAPSDRFLIEGGYPAFEEKCVPRIGSLPPEIQERFKGWFGIE